MSESQDLDLQEAKEKNNLHRESRFEPPILSLSKPPFDQLYAMSHSDIQHNTYWNI